MFGYSVSSVNLREPSLVLLVCGFSCRDELSLSAGIIFSSQFLLSPLKVHPMSGLGVDVPVWMWNVVFWQEIAALFFATVRLFGSVERWGHVLHLGGRLRWT